jgi:hypothetical protein
MRERIKWTTYLAGGMENVNAKEMVSFRDEIKEKLDHPDLFIYNPVDQESQKVEKGAESHIEHIKGLKRAGKKEIFYEKMWKIWFGNIEKNTDLLSLFNNLRMRKHIDGNYRDEIHNWGDFEAVIRSDFLIVHLPKAVKSVGTIYEVMTAFLFRIPIYLIVNDAPATEVNSSLLFGTQISNGRNKFRIFRSINECVKEIRETYKLD